MLLAGDIGGTKTVLAIFSAEQGAHEPLIEKTYRSADHDSLEEIARSFLAEVQLPIEAAVFGVAGPVIQDRAEITNLPWIMEEGRLAAALQVRSVHLMNDLDAIGSSVLHLTPEDICTLIPGQPVSDGAIAVIAPGTGLGEAFMIWDGQRYQTHASEGGHANFAPIDERQIGLLRYMMERYEHVSFERVCSGIGIPNIYAYLRDSGEEAEPAWLADRLAAAADPTPIIVNAALDAERPCALCALTIETFVSILGSEAGNLALKVLATGGVYIGGGIPPRILTRLADNPSFITAFRDKGRFEDVLTRIPVHVILNSKAALIGAAVRGMSEFYGANART